MEGPAAAPKWGSSGGQAMYCRQPQYAMSAGGELRVNTGLSRLNSVLDMRQLSVALGEAREGTGEVRSILLRAAFKPRLPGLTKIVSKLSKEGCWRKALEVYESVEEMGLAPDTAFTNAAISSCDKGGRWQKALELFERMERLRLPRDAITYSATISALAKGKQWHAALQVFDHMQASHVEADVVACCSLINALERGGQWQLAEKLFLQMCTVQSDGQPPAPMFSANGKLMRAHSSPTSTLEGHRPTPDTIPPPLMTIGEGGGIPAHISATTSAFPSGRWGERSASLAILHSAAHNGGSVEELAAVLDKGLSLESTAAERQPSPDLNNPFAVAARMVGGLIQTPSGGSLEQLGTAGGSATCLQRGFSNAGSALSFQIPEDEAIFQTGAPLGHAYSMPPVSGSTHRSPGAASPLLRSPQRAGSLPAEEPPQVAAAQQLHHAMTAACSGDLGPTADQQQQQHQQQTVGAGLASMFNFSHAARVAPNRVCCNALLAAYARARPPQWQKALHLLAAMWQGGPILSPDMVSYNTVLKACANAFQLGRAMDVYREMVQRGVRPNITSYNCLIGAASDAGSYAALQQIGDWLDSADLEVRASCINAFVSGLVKVGHWDEAVSRFQAMLAPSSPVRPTASTFNTIMSGYMKHGEYGKVRDVFEDMLALGLSPSIVTYNTLLSSFASLGAWGEALDTLRRVLAAQLDGVAPNTATFNTVLAAIAKGAPSAPSQQHAYLASCALEVYYRMQSSSGSTPDLTTYTTLIKILDTAQHPQQILSIHEVMLSQGHTPDAPTATMVLNAAAQLGQVHKAVCLAHSLAVQGVPVDPALHAALLSTSVAVGAWDQAAMMCSALHAIQGPSPATTATFNRVLSAALSAGQLGAVVELLQLMRAAGLEVDPANAALVMGSQPTTPLTPTSHQQFYSAPPTPPALGTAHSYPSSPPAPYTPQAAAYSPMINGGGEGRPSLAYPGKSPTTYQASGRYGGSPHWPPLPDVHSVPRASLVTATPGEAFLQHTPPFQPSSVAMTPTAPPPPPPQPHAAAQHMPAAAQQPPQPGDASEGTPADPHADSAARSPSMACASLEEAKRLLAELKNKGDARAGLEVLDSLKAGGIQPDKATFTHLIQLLVRAGQPHSAVQLCCEAHTAGVLHHYALPDISQGPPPRGTALGNVIDLRGCGLEEGVTVLLTWLTRVAQLQPQGLTVKDRTIKIITGHKEAQDLHAAGLAEDGHLGRPACSLSSQLVSMLTTGRSPVPAFDGLVPFCLPTSSVWLSQEDTSILEVQTAAVYKAIPTTA
ncbi:hypothetical protein N2152v2_009197 [Parachlorella kessleri]